MSELEKFVSRGILARDHNFNSEDEVLQAVAYQLAKLGEENEQLKKAQEQAAAVSETPPSPPSQTPPAPAPAPGTSEININTARTLQQAGLFDRKDGRWVAKSPSDQVFADRLNQHELQVQTSSQQAMELLATDKQKFIETYLGDHLKVMIEGQVKPLQDELSNYVQQPFAEDTWYNQNKERLGENHDTPLARAYSQIREELSQQHSHLKDQLGDRGYRDYIHNMAAAQAELQARKIENTATPPADSGTQVTPPPEQAPPESTSTADERSLVDRVNDGDGAGVSGQRNEGSSRLLNDHSDQVGDTNQPVTSQGRVNFLAIAEKAASEAGIKI